VKCPIVHHGGSLTFGKNIAGLGGFEKIALPPYRPENAGMLDKHGIM
jgi:hypothetical protein